MITFISNMNVVTVHMIVKRSWNFYWLVDIIFISWISTSPSPHYLDLEDKEAICPSLKKPKPKGSSRFKESFNSSKLPHKPDLQSLTQYLPSIPLTVRIILLSWMGRSNALPSNRPIPLLGLCRQHFIPVGTTKITKFFYSYNYNVFTTNIRYRTFRNIFPFFVAYIFADAYSSYRKQILKINLFDEYCYLRSQELVQQN